MAKKVDTFPIPGNRGTDSKYPWDEWLDGDIWELTPGEDFECSPQSIQLQAKQRAARMGLRTRSANRGGKVTIQAYR